MKLGPTVLSMYAKEREKFPVKIFEPESDLSDTKYN